MGQHRRHWALLKQHLVFAGSPHDQQSEFNINPFPAQLII